MCFPPLSGKKTPKIAFAAFHFCYVADDTQFPAVKKRATGNPHAQEAFYVFSFYRTEASLIALHYLPSGSPSIERYGTALSDSASISPRINFP